ncbi:MAG: endolytic transglycosylase MltG [Candidatus Muiribacteriota bacterium]
MKIKIILTLIILCFLSLISGIYYFKNYKITLNTELIVNSGDSLNAILNKMKLTNVDKNIIKFYFKHKKTSGKIKPGIYKFNDKYNLSQIEKILTTVQTIDYVRFTIIPGETFKDFKRKFTLKYSEELFNEVYKHIIGKYDYMKQFKNYEGFLAPDTYFVNSEPETGGKEVILMAAEKFHKNYYELYKKSGFDKLSFFEACVLASIVEREGMHADEKRKMAGVFINRLDKNILLESCATVQYALPEYKPTLTYKDLEISSPYNTYKNRGLPPGPICFFSLNAFKAVLEYEQHDFLYFILIGDGKHHFSRTLEEHNRMKRNRK